MTNHREKEQRRCQRQARSSEAIETKGVVEAIASEPNQLEFQGV